MAENVTVLPVEDGMRLMRWFARHYPNVPNRDFYKICRGGQLRVNGKNNSLGDIGNISELPFKNIKHVELYSCNAGNLDYYQTDEWRGAKNDYDHFYPDPGNVASVLSTRISGTVKAYDGNVGFGPGGVLSIFNDSDYSPRLSNSQKGFYQLNEEYGTEKRDPAGVVYYQGGKLLK